MNLAPLITALILSLAGFFSSTVNAEENPRMAMLDPGSQLATQSVAGNSRWYSAADVDRGRDVYAANCAVCHGARAQGATVGALRVPALDGGGHSAHHGLSSLLEKVRLGGTSDGGKMPAFGAVLDESQRREAIAWIQSVWPDAVYASWQRMQRGGHH